jgi:hypothetical protein
MLSLSSLNLIISADHKQLSPFSIFNKNTDRKDVEVSIWQTLDFFDSIPNLKTSQNYFFVDSKMELMYALPCKPQVGLLDEDTNEFIRYYPSIINGLWPSYNNNGEIKKHYDSSCKKFTLKTSENTSYKLGDYVVAYIQTPQARVNFVEEMQRLGLHLVEVKELKIEQGIVKYFVIIYQITHLTNH